MIDWTLLPKKFGHEKKSKKFEKLALLYAKDVYEEYDWQPTMSSHDGNKDIYLGEGVESDAWWEAKYKEKDALRRQDLDPTVLSGLIQGNVRLIIFISNAHLPEKLLSRSILGAKIRGIEVSCVLRKQLESWLFHHPEHYKNIFEEDLPVCDIDSSIVEIYEASFYEIISKDFNPFAVKKEMFVGEDYLLSVVIYSSHSGTAKLVTDSHTPFVPVNHSNSENPENITLKEGINEYTFIIRAYETFNSNRINIRFIINSAPFSQFSNEVIIRENNTINITYAQQLEIMNNIKGIIDYQSPISMYYVITIFAESGMGKSYVLEKIYTEYALKRDMTTVVFESHEQNNTNDCFLCKILLFLNYGNIFWGGYPKDIAAFKNTVLSRNVGKLFENDLLNELIDGCFYKNIAINVIEKIFNKMKQKKILAVRRSLSKFGRLLLLDDFQYLNEKQAKFISLLCELLIQAKNNCVIVISATKGKFRNKNTERIFYELTPNILLLSGLVMEDKASTLNNYFNLPLPIARSISQKILVDSPLLTSEILRTIRSKKPKIGEVLDILKAYATQEKSSVILQDRFMSFRHQFYLLDIIYRFKRGIDSSFLYKYDKFKKNKLADDIQALVARGLLKKDESRLYPYHDYYTVSYKQLRAKKFFNKAVGRYLKYLLNSRDISLHFDESQLLSQLIRCGKSYFYSFEEKIKEQIKLNINASNFGSALYYCEYYYEVLKQKDPATYSRTELYFLYLHADCLVHCGKNGLAERMLEEVYNFSTPDSIESLEAGTALLNQQFWNMNLDTIIDNSYLIQRNIEHILKTELTEEEHRRMRKAKSTCHNRRMVTQLLLDKYQEARKTYFNRLKMIATESNEDKYKYKSRSATLIMDYARGIAYKNPQEALRLMKVALRYFECRESEHLRRMLLCKIDLIILHSINGLTVDKIQLRLLVKDLLDNQFYSESFKALLKYHAADIIETSQYLEQFTKSETGNSFNLVLENATKEIYTHLLEIGLEPISRENFLYSNLMAYIYAKNGNLSKAMECLDNISAYISPAGESYHLILTHNKNNIFNVKTIAWCTENTTFEKDTFLLDCRFW